MNCRLAHQRKDNSHDEISKDHDATRGGAYCRGGRPILERKLRPEHHVQSRDGGSGYHRAALDPGELCRSRTAYGPAVRGWRVLLLEVAIARTIVPAFIGAYDFNSMDRHGAALNSRSADLTNESRKPRCISATR